MGLGKNDEFSIDRAFDGILGSKLYSMQIEYFDCIMEVQKKSEVSQLVVNNFYKFPIGEQIELLKAQLVVSAICEKLAIKHGIIPDPEEDCQNEV